MGQIKTRCSTAAGLFLILLTVITGFSSCKSNQKDIIPSAEYAPYVNAYTGGVISQNSTIRIELTQDQPMVDLNQELKDNPFSFSPSLKGKTYWVSNNTIEFVPRRRGTETRRLLRRNLPPGRFRRCRQKAGRIQLLFPRAGTKL